MNITPHRLRSIHFVICSTITGLYALFKEKNVTNVKKKLDSKTDNKVKPVPIQLKLLVDEVAKELKLGEKFSVTPYISEGTDLVTTSRCIVAEEVFLGIPQYFVFDKDDDTRFSAVIDGKDITKTAPEYQSLKEVMCLSMEAKKFGIARELLVADLERFSFTLVLPIVVGITGFLLSLLMERSFIKAKKPHSTTLHSALLLSLAWFYTVFHDVASIYQDGRADLSATELGKSYVQGGLEYYQKMIKRNTFLKKINKHAPYTENGDVNTKLIRRYHMPLPTRVTYLEDINKGREVDLWKSIFNKV